MNGSDTSEGGLEWLIFTALAGHPCDPLVEGTVADSPGGHGGLRWSGGNFHDYDRQYSVDRVQLAAFLRGTIEVLLRGIKHGTLHLELFYGTPSAGRRRSGSSRTGSPSPGSFATAGTRRSGRWTSRCSSTGWRCHLRAEEHSLTKQTVDDAVLQYQQDRNPREKLFEFGRCTAHFVVDEREVQFCTHLARKASWFLPFNPGAGTTARATRPTRTGCRSTTCGGRG